MNTRIIYASKTPISAPSKYTTLIFDLGGVLIDWHTKTVEAVVNKLFPKSAATKIIRTLVADPLWQDFNRGSTDIDLIAIRAEIQHNFDATFTKKILTTFPQQLPLFHQMVTIIESAKAQGFKLYVLSNVSKPYLALYQKHIDCFKHFDGIMGSCYAGSLKPEPTIYKALFEQFAINPTEALFIDDLEENILVGNSFGMDGLVCIDHNAVTSLLEQNNILRIEK